MSNTYMPWVTKLETNVEKKIVENGEYTITSQNPSLECVGNAKLSVYVPNNVEPEYNTYLIKAGEEEEDQQVKKINEVKENEVVVTTENGTKTLELFNEEENKMTKKYTVITNVPSGEDTCIYYPVVLDTGNYSNAKLQLGYIHSEEGIMNQDLFGSDLKFDCQSNSLTLNSSFISNYYRDDDPGLVALCFGDDFINASMIVFTETIQSNDVITFESNYFPSEIKKFCWMKLSAIGYDYYTVPSNWFLQSSSMYLVGEDNSNVQFSLNSKYTFNSDFTEAYNIPVKTGVIKRNNEVIGSIKRLGEVKKNLAFD